MLKYKTGDVVRVVRPPFDYPGQFTVGRKYTIESTEADGDWNEDDIHRGYPYMICSDSEIQWWVNGSVLCTEEEWQKICASIGGEMLKTIIDGNEI